ncbi:vegetative cell wall protein gp1-like [Oncorhynchus tshawytscha]|uniref:vegetative cell wall protein gp1-like n=1 Tax=Oncorhynchus tshawytscha TaxID=74940 RepID=UPI001C3C6F1C|nr:vegetative cell wall protein gp1-like [Oncorhynchus tshawytscha]
MPPSPYVASPATSSPAGLPDPYPAPQSQTPRPNSTTQPVPVYPGASQPTSPEVQPYPASLPDPYPSTQAKTAGKDGVPHQKSPAVPINKEPARKFAPVVTSPAPPAAEVVKSSVLPQVDIVPSSNIKDIIRQYDSPPPVTDALPPGKRRPEGKFMKMQNPRDEALQILKPQMDNPPPQPKRPLGPSPSAMALKEAGVNPTTHSHRDKHLPSTLVSISSPSVR